MSEVALVAYARPDLVIASLAQGHKYDIQLNLKLYG